MTHKHSATLLQLHTALEKDDGNIRPCTTVCVLHVSEMAVRHDVNFFLHQQEINVVFKGREERWIRHRAPSASLRGGCTALL